MKRLLLVLVLTTAISNIYAQDLIVTEKGDSLNCKITRMDKDYIYFTIQSGGVNQNTLLPKSSIKSHAYKYYGVGTSSFDVTDVRYAYPKFRLEAHGGATFRIAKIGDGLNYEEWQHVKKMKRGYNLGVNGSYFFNKTYGIGLSFERYRASGTLQSVKDKISIYHIAPTFNMRFLFGGGRSGLIFDYSLGYLGYLQKLKDTNLSKKITGGTLGLGMGIGYDLGLSERVGLAFRVSLISGVLSKVTVTANGVKETITFSDDSREGLAHINLTVGLRLQ